MTAKSLIYQFLDVRVEVSRFRALREGRALALEPKAIETLIFLLDRPGRLVEKDELLNGVWKESFVTPNAMTRIIAQLRRELGDDAKTPHIIQTVPTRGYVFLPEVRRHEEELPRALTGEAALTAVVSAARRVTRTLSGKLRPVVADEPDEFERAEIAASEAGEHAPGAKTNECSPAGSVTGERPPVVNGYAENNESLYTDFPEPAAPTPARPPSGFLRRSLFASFALIVIAAAAWAIAHWSSPRPVETRAIAVLPFRPLVAADRDESFEMGMTETLIVKLGALRQVQVRPFSAIRRYTQLDQDPLAAGRELRAEAVLDGSIQKVSNPNADRARVTVRLLRVADGEQLWGESFDQPIGDIFSVQDRIAEQVAGALRLALTGAEQRQLRHRETYDPDAYQLCLQGRYLLQKRTPDGFKKAATYFQQAVERDPRYGTAYLGLAACHSLPAIFGALPPRVAMPRAEELATRALQLDDSLAEAYIILASVRAQYRWDWAGAERELALAEGLNANLPDVYHYRALVWAAQGRMNESRAELKHALQLDSDSPILATAESWLAYLARDYSQAISAGQSLIDRWPNFYLAYLNTGQAYLAQGSPAEALPLLIKARALAGENIASSGRLGQAYARSGRQNEARRLLAALRRNEGGVYGAAWIHLGLGERDAALACLSQAVDDRAAEVIYLRADPIYDDLRADARFTELLKRIGLPASKP
jgi:DNA-binding winged helix-turn-helix (wHTH) protein/TolB-like protein/Flp pilus assembly protein TadD